MSSSTSRTCRGATSPSRYCRATSATPSCGACSTPRPTCSPHLSAHPAIVTVYQAGHLGRRPAVHRHGVLPRLARRSATASSASPSTRCSTSACGWRARSSPRTAPASCTATSSRATSSSRTFGTPVLADFGISSSLLRPTADEILACRSPGARPRSSQSETAGTVRERGLEPRRDRLLAARRPQPVRAPRPRPEHQGAAAPPHLARELHRRSPAPMCPSRCRPCSRPR